ncbi:hypothetical protein IMZ31_19090 (plasmid) [Pontibacillus sp. ALD_SL1]|uniref:hypothetical protein n=1 Tax=Pontibacillus sp. ALD_SL1 TaxID=2777185 RepID=UPI001A96BA75|nr:hypothetical protein [Pontibacillus sp. ALD_SL1]QST02656.1 hypothetical protein IMZ31_19090 [Pontibacillus sp. ALD_SL1]
MKFTDHYRVGEFRNDVVKVTKEGLRDIKGGRKIETYEDIVNNLEDENVYEEFKWALCNVAEILINAFVEWKGIVASDYAEAPISESAFDYRDGVVHVVGKVHFRNNEIDGIEEPSFHAEYELKLDEFHNDAVIENLIEQVGVNLEEQTTAMAS